MSISESIRHQLITLARRKNARVVDWSPERPTDWRPQSVRNPGGILDTHFTDAAAWELIASQLEAGYEVETIILEKPPGAKGYVMLIELEPDECPSTSSCNSGQERSLEGASTTQRKTRANLK